jgi:hypothetical protein
MPNRLVNESSPYLLQHADNPVDWYPWSPEALEKARAEDKPIFLSIGYMACHWCHVMAHESFEDAGIATIMNENFVNIKVDREERPDLDGIYMQAVVALTGQGGWPMSVFITPQGKPFYGGTYFPPVRRYNMPAFSEILTSIAHLWRENRTRLLESSEQVGDYLRQKPAPKQPGIPLEELTSRAALILAQGYDWKHGGWGKAPKFPQPMAIEFLLQRAARGDLTSRDAAFHALKSMARGGMYDVVGGGFARYSTDERWLVPHFEKMLYDNAQLALAYLHGWQLSGENQFRQVCQQTLDFILREMTHAGGGFYSSLDADSEGEEGKFYVWTLDEVRKATAGAGDAGFLAAAYDLTPGGNFEGANVLQRAMNDEELGSNFNLSPAEAAQKLEALHQRLLAARSKRVRPNTDDKILAAWNGLALRAFAEAARSLGRRDYLSAAQSCAQFLLENMILDGRLQRSWREGKARHAAYLEDHAALALGLLALYQADGNVHWYAAAKELAGRMRVLFSDPDGGFFDTGGDHEALLLRPKDLQDNATPSGNALAACALLQLAAYEGQPDWRAQAETMIAGASDQMVRYPTAFAQWLQAADFALGPVQEVAIIGEAVDAQTQALAGVLWNAFRPRLVVAVSTAPPHPAAPALLRERQMLNNRPTAYVCRDFACLQPVTTPQELSAQLDDHRPK